MNKGIITIFVGSDITQEEINEIRAQINKECNEKYILNVIISGEENFNNNLKNFIRYSILQ